MSSQIRKEVPYYLNYNHPYFQEVHFAENQLIGYSGPWDKLPLTKFIDKVMGEEVKLTDGLYIYTSKASYKLRNHNVYEVVNFYLQLRKLNRPYEHFTWYLFDTRHGPYPDLGPYYCFFVAGRNQIEFEKIDLELKEDIDFDILKSPDYEKKSYNHDKVSDKVVARYWYKRFYKETQTGQIEVIREEIENEPLEKESQAPDMESSQKIFSDLTKVFSSVNSKLSFIALLLIILAVLQLFR